MKNKQSGFSLIELLLVVVIIGVIAAIAVPSLMKARTAAEDSSAYSAMRTLATLQTSYYTRNNRYATISELITDQQIRLGTMDGTTLRRGSFSFKMSPDVNPQPDTLKNEYQIIASRPGYKDDPPYLIKIDQSAVITQITEPGQ